MSVVHRVYVDDPELRPQTLAHHIARYEFATRRLTPGGLVLDLMCGSGYGAEILREAGSYVVGIDGDAGAISYAQANYPDNIFLHMQAQDVRVRDYFSGVTWFEGVEHISKDDGLATFERCADALLPGGLLMVSTPRDTNEKYNPWHLSKWSLADLRAAALAHFTLVEALGQDWDTAAISADDVLDNDFYLLVCRK